MIWCYIDGWMDIFYLSSNIQVYFVELSFLVCNGFCSPLVWFCLFVLWQRGEDGCAVPRDRIGWARWLRQPSRSTRGTSEPGNTSHRQKVMACFKHTVYFLNGCQNKRFVSVWQFAPAGTVDATTPFGENISLHCWTFNPINNVIHKFLRPSNCQPDQNVAEKTCCTFCHLIDYSFFELRAF